MFEIIAFMRFSTSETSRFVVLDLQLAWLLLGGLTFADFQERMSPLLCCKVLIDEWCQEIMAIFVHQLLIADLLLAVLLVDQSIGIQHSSLGCSEYVRT